MFSSRLMLTFYLWFLLALTLTVLGTTGVVVSLYATDWEERGRAFLLEETDMAREILENLGKTGLTLDQLADVLSPLRRHRRKGLVYALVDNQGQVRGAENPDFPDSMNLKAMTDKALKAGVQVEIHRGDSLAISVPLVLSEGQQGVFHVGHVYHEQEPHEFRGGRMIAGLGAVLVLGWLLCWPLAAYLTRPLRKMTAVADALGSGDFSARIPLHRKDEIGVLAKRFNLMAESLANLLQNHKRLLADISHELRSPLSRLEVALELARDEMGPRGEKGEKGGKQAEYLDKVAREASNLEEMIEELLYYSRLDTSPYQPERERLSAGELLNEALGQVEDEAARREVRLELEPVEPPVILRGDRRMLLRALGNVIRNAVAHSPRGASVRVALRLEGGQMAFVVSDSGAGVPVEELENIFKPFYRTDSARGRTTGGVGLGLAIARRCMETHGGGARASTKQAEEQVPMEGQASTERVPMEGVPMEHQGLTVRLWLPDSGE